MKSITNRIYFDSWRKINEPLFVSYISCYSRLANDKTLDPADELVKSLSENNILGKVNSNAYGSAYIPARELGIFYNDNDDNFILSKTAKAFINGDYTYQDYMKTFVVNYKALINNVIISPFEIIRDKSLHDSLEKTTDEIFSDCKQYFSDGTQDDLAKTAMTNFLSRAVEAILIVANNKKFKISDKDVYTIKVPDLAVTQNEFISKYLGGSKQAQENYVKDIIDRTVSIPNATKTMKHPLNQILFGPPGTGKTYSTITRALNIIGLLEEKDIYTKDEYAEAQELFQNELGKRIEFVTMHQSFSYEDFVQGLKPKTSGKGTGIEFDYKNGVFKEICKRAEEYVTGDALSETTSLTNRNICKIAFFLSKYNGKGKTEKKANEVLGFESDNDAFIGIGENINMNPNSIKNHRDKFDFMFNNREGYTARKGWTPRNDDGVLDNTTNWPYREVYDELNEKSFESVTKIILELINSKTDKPEESFGNENFVIILDEINRANISRVFGELIALIEKDKRDGKLTATLPSGEAFTVPSNLYIIGTMNTADKSIALVDIALRRRFDFIPLYPDTIRLAAVLNENNFTQTDIDDRVRLLTNLNRIIRAKKSVDFEIGHSYFMEDDELINILNKQVLPLLNEYFMYDLKKVKEILEKSQKDREGKTIPKPGILLNKKVWEERGLLIADSISESSDEPETTEEEVVSEA